MAAKRLRAVEPNETATPAKRYTVTEAAEHGTQRDLLVALRERIAKAVQDVSCSTRDLAALSKRLTDITKEIEAIDAREAQSGDDEATPDDAWEAV